MGNGRIDIRFDIKNMGLMFFVPLFIITIAFFYFIYITDTSINLIQAFPVVEFIVVPFSCWWIIYLFYDYYELKGGEILLSYPLSDNQHGLFRILLFNLIYLVPSLIVVVYITINSNAKFTLLILQYIPEFIFFSGLGFILITLFKNTSVVITIISFYVATEFLTNGQFLPWYHVFYINESPLNFYEVINKSIVNLAIGFLFIRLGEYFLRGVKN